MQILFFCLHCQTFQVSNLTSKYVSGGTVSHSQKIVPNTELVMYRCLFSQFVPEQHNIGLTWDVNEALVPAAAISNKALQILRYIRNISGGLVIV